MPNPVRTYLDAAATAPLRPQAKAAMLAAFEHIGNPSGIHQEAQSARFLVDTARRTMADLFSIRAERLIFTSGGTESNNLALRGFAAANPGKTIAISAIEHDCIRTTGATLNAALIPVHPNGLLNLEALETLLRSTPIGLVSVMHAHNESGVLQPLADIAALCHRHGALLHTDAVQTTGHMPVLPDALGADMLTFTAHKFGGPKGVGGLVIKPETPLTAQLTGGGQERNRRAGTENTAAIAGMAAAFEAAVAAMDAETATATTLATALETGLPAHLRMVGADAPKLPHIRQILLPETSPRTGEDAVMALDLAGIAASQGSACSSGKTTGSASLIAMGYSPAQSRRALRLSWSWANILSDIPHTLPHLSTL